MDPQVQSLLIFALVGIAAGWLASIVVGGGGLVRYLITGVLGALVGGFVLSALNITLGIENVILAQIVTAAIGAIVVVLVARIIA